MSNTNGTNGYTFASLSIGEALQSPDTCDCCGRDGLKRTVKLVNPDGNVVWFGTGCAAVAMSTPEKLVKSAARKQVEAAKAREAARVNAERNAAFADWQAFLNAHTAPELHGEIFRQVEALGGMKAARALYAAAGAR